MSNTQWQVNDSNTNKGSGPIDYEYGIWVTYGGSSYNHDPKIENVEKG